MSDDEIAELLGALGPVTIRRVFGGKGVYVHGVIVAMEHGGELRLKADAVSAPAFMVAGAMQWAYSGHRGQTMLPYWSIPHEALDDPDQMAEWAKRALDAGLRTAAGKPVRKRDRTNE